ncbi:CVNH domain-containing protein [Apiospora arundinis]
MKVISVLSTLVAVSAAGDWGNTCHDEKFDAATGVVTANCDTGDNTGTLQATTVNLNSCFGWNGKSLVGESGGNYGQSCTGCTLNRIQDPIYFTRFDPWLNCTCGDAPVDTGFNTARVVSNKFGALLC